MLPAAHRLRRSRDFDTAVRRGRRAGRPTVVVHVAIDEHDGAGPARVGFVVSRAVGPAVVRNRTKRRLRAMMADRLEQLPAGSLVVVRALGGAGNADSAVLATDLGAALGRALRPSDRPARRAESTGRDAGRPR